MLFQKSWFVRMSGGSYCLRARGVGCVYGVLPCGAGGRCMVSGIGCLMC